MVSLANVPCNSFKLQAETHKSGKIIVKSTPRSTTLSSTTMESSSERSVPRNVMSKGSRAVAAAESGEAHG